MQNSIVRFFFALHCFEKECGRDIERWPYGDKEIRSNFGQNQRDKTIWQHGGWFGLTVTIMACHSGGPQFKSRQRRIFSLPSVDENNSTKPFRWGECKVHGRVG